MRAGAKSGSDGEEGVRGGIADASLTDERGRVVACEGDSCVEHGGGLWNVAIPGAQVADESGVREICGLLVLGGGRGRLGAHSRSQCGELGVLRGGRRRR